MNDVITETTVKRLKRLTHEYIDTRNGDMKKRMEGVYKDILWYIEVCAKNSETFSCELTILGILKRSCLESLSNEEINFLIEKLRKIGLSVSEQLSPYDNKITGLFVTWAD